MDIMQVSVTIIVWEVVKLFVLLFVLFLWLLPSCIADRRWKKKTDEEKQATHILCFFKGKNRKLIQEAVYDAYRVGFYSWEDELPKEKQLLLRRALLDFYRGYRNIKPDKELDEEVKRKGYFWYASCRLWEVKKALERGDYRYVWHELEEIATEDREIAQKRVHLALTNLLEEYFGAEAEN